MSIIYSKIIFLYPDYKRALYRTRFKNPEFSNRTRIQMVHVLRDSMNQPKNQISPLFPFLARMFVLQQVPVYLTPERASELAIVSAHRREEPALNEPSAAAAASMPASLKPHNVSKNRTRRRGRRFNTRARWNPWRAVSRAVKSSPPVFGRLSTYLLRGWPFSGLAYLAAAFAYRVYFFHQRAESENIDTARAWIFSRLKGFSAFVRSRAYAWSRLHVSRSSNYTGRCRAFFYGIDFFFSCGCFSWQN